jgi:hypothetical protein
LSKAWLRALLQLATFVIFIFAAPRLFFFLNFATAAPFTALEFLFYIPHLSLHGKQHSATK